MFEFMTRRHAQPADTPLEEVRFTREDIFLLAGGFDSMGFALTQFTFDIVGYARHRGAPWREDMVARLAPLGLVDASGTPSDELAAAVGPLSSLGVMFTDGDHPTSRRDPRTASVSIDGDRATALVKADRRGGFRIVPLGERSTWPGKVERIFGLPPVFPAPEPASYRFSIGVSKGLGAAMRAGDVGRVRAACDLMGLPAEPLCSLVPWVGRRGSILRDALIFCSLDYRGSSYLEPEGVYDFRMVLADSPRFHTMHSILHPAIGVSFTEAYGVVEGPERPGYPCRIDSFVCVDFLPPGFDLLAYVTDFYDIPPEPGEEGTSCSSS
ncbi:MAG: hypothetical protein E7001_03215 [Coriobacteriaceae bacterium]|nr:hypothetical protein [Coriobacteriaceae bacterium]